MTPLEVVAFITGILAVCAVTALIADVITTPRKPMNIKQRYRQASSQIKMYYFKATIDILRIAARHYYGGGNHRL
jgi:hypothetical protein